MFTGGHLISIAKEFLKMTHISPIVSLPKNNFSESFVPFPTRKEAVWGQDFYLFTYFFDAHSVPGLVPGIY